MLIYVMLLQEITATGKEKSQDRKTKIKKEEDEQ